MHDPLPTRTERTEQMNTKMLSKIETAIQSFIEKNCETDLFQEFVDGHYVHEQLAAQMALAAYTVFEASIDAQEFAKDQG